MFLHTTAYSQEKVMLLLLKLFISEKEFQILPEGLKPVLVILDFMTLGSPTLLERLAYGMVGNFMCKWKGPMGIIPLLC